jgi:hypothetical protein
MSSFDLEALQRALAANGSTTTVSSPVEATIENSSTTKALTDSREFAPLLQQKRLLTNITLQVLESSRSKNRQGPPRIEPKEPSQAQMTNL